MNNEKGFSPVLVYGEITYKISWWFVKEICNKYGHRCKLVY